MSEARSSHLQIARQLLKSPMGLAMLIVMLPVMLVVMFFVMR